MFDFLALFSQVLQAATWLLLLATGAWLYRRMRLRSLPWLGAYAVLLLLEGHVTMWLLVPLIDRGAVPTGWTVGEFTVAWHYGTLTLRSLSGLLVAIMAAGEVDGLVSRFGAGPHRRSILLLAAREATVPMGVAVLGLTLAEPLAAAMCWVV